MRRMNTRTDSCKNIPSRQRVSRVRHQSRHWFFWFLLCSPGHIQSCRQPHAVTLHRTTLCSTALQCANTAASSLLSDLSFPFPKVLANPAEGRSHGRVFDYDLVPHKNCRTRAAGTSVHVKNVVDVECREVHMHLRHTEFSNIGTYHIALGMRASNVS